jgi:hypothetical protein
MNIEHLDNFLKSYNGVKEDIEIENYDKAIPKMFDLRDELEMFVDKSINNEYVPQLFNLFCSSKSLYRALQEKDANKIGRATERFEIYFKQLKMRLEAVANQETK